ncbi:MAG: hypothetical protein KF795_17895 [Labilithrix sp.]|nr:hypothetical protein [Labilithrix sp.]
MKHARVGVLLLLVGCAGTGVRQVRSVGGEPIYKAKCQSSSADCIADARSTCSDGYEVLDSEAHAGGVLADALPGPVTWYVLTFQCTGFATASRPAFPFRGPTHQAPASEANASSASRPRASTTPSAISSPASATKAEAPRECSSDMACGMGYVCAKPAGSFSGECARAVNGMGMPVLTTPRANVGPGERQCRWATECGIGFECDRGRCLKR